jgi:hypothetical protein
MRAAAQRHWVGLSMPRNVRSWLHEHGEYMFSPDAGAAMVALSAKGFSLREIAQRLNDDGGTRPRNGGLWYASTVRSVLKRQGTLSATT